jgi:hypothetical protein
MKIRAIKQSVENNPLRQINFGCPKERSSSVVGSGRRRANMVYDDDDDDVLLSLSFLRHNP